LLRATTTNRHHAARARQSRTRDARAFLEEFRGTPDQAGRTRFTAAVAPSARELAQPVARTQVVLQARLRAAGFRRVAVLPAHQRRQAHQDRLAAPARLDAEQCAAVPEQVELDVAPAPVKLEGALAFAVR